MLQNMFWAEIEVQGKNFKYLYIIFKYNQKDATLYNILYCCQWSRGSSKQARHISDVVCTVF